MLFLVAILGIFFIYKITNVLLLLFASFVIANALYPVVDWMSKKLPRGIVVALVYLIGFIIILTLLIPFIMVIVTQSQEFIKKFPEYWQHMVNFVSDAEIFVENFGFIPDYSDVFSNATKIGQDLISKSINFTLNMFAGLVAAFTMAVIILFLLLDKEHLHDVLIKLFPTQHRKKAEEITLTISKKVGGYVRGQLFLMFAVGLLTGIGLKIIGMEFALLLGIIAGILEIVPIVGPFIAAVPAVFVALAQNPILALWAVLVYIIVQRIENHFLTPFILGKFLDMHPLIIIIAILIAASMLGVFGVILSPALAAVIYVLVQELYIKKLEKKC